LRNTATHFQTGTLLDWTGTPILRDAAPPLERIADTAGVREPWATRYIREVSPELAARVLRPDADLGEQMAFCKRIGRDDQIYSVTRSMKLQVAGLDWQILPFDESAKAEEIRAFVEAVFMSLPRFAQLLVHLLDGVVKPLAGAEIQYDPKTWLPIGFTKIDPLRWVWNRETNALNVRTIRAPQGEPLTPNGFIVHRSDDEPLWEKFVWLFIFSRFAKSEWVRFAELYGKPIRIAFYQDKNEKEAILAAVRDIGVNAAGVFPEGTEIRLEEAARGSATSLFQALKRECDEGISKVALGHALGADARTGTGMQGGRAAKQMSDENRQSLAVSLAETIRVALIRPMVGWHFGWQYETQLPTFKLAWEPPEDLKAAAETLKIASDLLAASGEAIDPEFIRQKFGITKTVKRVSTAAPVAAPKSNEQAPASGDAAAKRRELIEVQPGIFVARDETEQPLIRSVDDVQAVAVRLAARAQSELAHRVRAKADQAPSVDEFLDSLFEEYDALPQTKMAAIVRDAALTAHELGRDAAQ
jgi:phage gp29-like protein